MEVEVSTLHAFSDKALGGNPAGVVLQATHLSESQMQEVARQVGFSETAFVMPSDQADFKVRFFTPSDEVDLCGHATIALFYLMKTQQLVDVGTYTLETLAGILKVVIEVNGEVYLSQTLPEFGRSWTVSRLPTHYAFLWRIYIPNYLYRLCLPGYPIS